MFKVLFATTLLVSATVGAFAQSPAPQRSGTPEEQKSCAPDVSRHCRTVMNDGDLVILGCLQANRAKISKKCDAVLRSHGQ
ncbi:MULTISPECIES: hypothetical protein [unclassified Afipia]|uniref:hypothetical protein n=1 Tax=unclassified Afipia TaxID=2642050 RepID=UPI000406BB53|nr:MULTISPECIES: hypothetical protein [unclassified Afipia]